MRVQRIGIRAGVALLFLCLLAAPLRAQAVQAPQAGPSTWAPTFGLYGGNIQGASIALGVMRVVERSGDFTIWRGPRVVFEPGLRAGKVRVGWAQSGAFAAGYAIEAAAVRRWRGENMYGGEVHISMMFVDLGLGLYRGATGALVGGVSLGLVM